MEEIPISKFKAKCLALLEQVSRTRKPLRITRHGKPVAEVNPPSREFSRADMAGSMKSKTKILGDIISPAIDEDEWEVLRN